jgi:ABC-type branched-subunit amino acid transport system ATPase component
MSDSTESGLSSGSQNTRERRPTGDDSILTVDGLDKTFGSLVAIDDLDLEVREGEVHGLIGPNGAGKTTLINLITGELKPTSGSVRFDGEELTGLSPSTIAKRGVGRSFQVVQFFPEMTVREHLHLALRDPTTTVTSILQGDSDHEDRISEIADVVHLEEQLGTVAKNLSYGEQRYLEIGLVLALDADLILFDEPAAGLNSAETEDLRQIIDDLRGDYTILIIEHNIDLVRRLVDRISVLHGGSLLATGAPDEIVENERVKEVYLGE